jgi:hypothetical protein
VTIYFHASYKTMAGTKFTIKFSICPKCDGKQR